MSNLQWRIGEVLITRVEEQTRFLPVTRLMPGSTAAEFAVHADWLFPWAADADGNVVIAIQTLGVEADGQRMVVDTCVGQRPLPGRFADMADDGSFLVALSEAGFGRHDVDTVICTHLHFDHVGWNTMLVDGEWVPTFPEARYLVARPEYEHWRDAGADARAVASALSFDDAVLPLFDHGVVDLVEVDHIVSSSVSLTHTPGHTPGHVSVQIESHGAEALITGDCVHHAVQLAEPQWASGADSDPELSIATRKMLVEALVDSAVLVIGTHFPPPTAGHAVSTPDGVRFEPLV